jgi:aryl-alcohol dehydrogenase-like predicted oxidoreductase
MRERKLGATGFSVSEIGLGTWQVGGRWGESFDDRLADRTIGEAIDRGVTFFDTADVYSGGDSEKAVGRALKSHRATMVVATKCGRQISPHLGSGYTPEALRRYVEDSLRRLGTDCLDLIQLHCPPTEVYYRPEIFALFARLKDEGKIRDLGVSVEKVEEALKAIEFPNVRSVQIIFNMFRQRPAELFFKEAARRGVGVIVRVPLASGLLSGRYTRQTSFGPEDHRSFNREGAAFDKGETFSGVEYETGLAAVDELKAVLPQAHPSSGEGAPGLASWALRWILMFDAVSVVIPGASRPEQVAENLKAAELRPLTGSEMAGVAAVYDRLIRDPVHFLW